MGSHPLDACALSRTKVVGMSKKRVKVTVRRDPEEGGTWLVNVAGSPGAQTFGRSLGEAKRHGVEMVALWFDLEPGQLDIDWDVRLGDLAGPVKQARSAMAHADADRLRRDEAVRALTEAGVSYRDIAELLGLSHQRVAQIARAS
jgi:hypothetical protein